YLRAAERGDILSLIHYYEEGFPLNWQDIDTGETALHVIAACRARDCLRLYIKTNECDYLIRDNWNRLPSEMAYLYGNDPAVARLLGNKERKQAELQQVKLTRTETLKI
ncbi:MAG: hypothetical protein OQK82_06660, partial [Candidatus Pacearchaeota archaeon]|nr:hypothetical protein [Candidatus Pacearchaeota archaeon]